MSNYTIRDPLSVQFTKAPAIAIAGESGSGKTESALRLARGYCGPGKKFLIVDTEEKRALYKKERYQPWDWMDLQPPFTPENYIGALESAAQYPAVILDSGSHEYAGEGGLQDISADALQRMSGGDPSRAEKLSALSWKDAKVRHKKMMARLIRYPTLLIVCLRSEPKIKFQKDANGKTQIVDMGFMPICEKMFMYEMLVACQLHASNAGVPEHIKRLEPDLEPVFLPGKQLDEKTGERLAAWANARSKPNAAAQAPEAAMPRTGEPPAPGVTPAAAATIPDDAAIVKDVDHWIEKRKFKAAAEVASFIADDKLKADTMDKISTAYALVSRK